MKNLMLLALAAAILVAPGPALAQDPTLDKIKSSGEIVIGYRDDAAPFSSVSGDGAPEGYTIDLCLEAVRDLERKLALPGLRIRYEIIHPTDHIAKLNAGDVDLVCGATTATLKRREQVSFSLLTFVTGAELLVHDESGIRSAQDLEGRRVGVRQGTTTESALTAGLAAKGIDASIVGFSKHIIGLEALEDRRIDAYFGDRILLIKLADQAREPDRLTLSSRFLTYEPYALMMRRDSPDFRLSIDRSISRLYRTREITPIYDKWFGDLDALHNELLLKGMYHLQSLPEG
jgi:ABC-type amino acid transport substrate-binding protein